MNFSDKFRNDCKNEPLPFEEEEFEEETPDDIFQRIFRSPKDMHEEAKIVLNDKLDLFMELNQRLIDEFGIEDKDERYRILEIVICV